MSSDLSAEISAIATAVLALFAIVTAAYAIRAFGKQSQEVGLLVEDSRRQADERRKSQAARVFIEISDPPHHLGGYVHVVNASDFPVYNAKFWDFDVTGIKERDELGTIMPGVRSSDEIVILAAATRAFLTFHDSAGVRWIRMPGGGLREQSRITPEDSILAVAQLGQDHMVVLKD
jgi:hypothetical protein